MESEPYVPPIHSAARTSGLAIASLVLGILSFMLSILTGLPAIICGIVSLVKIGNSRGALGGSGMAVAGIVLGSLTSLMVPIMLALLLPAVQAAREAARANQALSDMRQMMLAMHQHFDEHQSLPAAGVDEDGNGPQLSWRVHILPYVGEQVLYEQFHLDEPWDSEHNQSLIPLMPDIYVNPNQPSNAPNGTTNYLAVTGPGAAFQGGERGPTLSQFTDGTSRTVTIVEADADQAVIWTKPDDWQFDPQNPMRGLGNLRPGVFTAAYADGHAERISNATDNATLKALMTRAGGD